MVGATAGAIQLITFAAFRSVLAPVLADVLALAIAAQFNFLLSYRFTWEDRRGATRHQLATRWLAFHFGIAGTAMLNIGIFTVARVGTPDPVALALGIAGAAVANYLVGDHVVFTTALNARTGLFPAAIRLKTGRPEHTIEEH